MKDVKILDKEFTIYLPNETIIKHVLTIAERVNTELKGKNIIFLGILNGAFMFASELFKHINIDCRISFLKLASYQGSTSTGKVKRLIGIEGDLRNQTVVVLEDIIDTGITIDYILKQLNAYEPAEIKIATMLFKPDAYKKDIPIDYVGLEIPNDFVVGFGLDYDGFGRNLKDIYVLKPNN